MLETDDGIALSNFQLSDVVGRNITCEDGITRRVEGISYSHVYADRVLINEINEDETFGGAWVHVLSLSCQMHGKPLPTKEQKEAFSRAMSAFRFTPEDKTQSTFIKLPSGIFVRN